VVKNDRGSLLPEDRCWDYGRRESGRIWWFVASLLLHGALLLFASGWIEPARLSTERPFIVSLVSPAPEAEAAEREVPVSEGERPPEEPAPAVLVEEELRAPHGEQGVPEAPQLDATPEPPVPTPLMEPALGESTGGETGTPERRRRDVAAEMAQRLLARIDTLGRLPLVVPARSPEESSESIPGVAPGSAAGITGPLGKRGLLYPEYPDFPAWAEEEGVDAAVRFKFWVSAAGNVVRIEVLTKSGYPEFETLARQALSRWRFEALPRGDEREEFGEVRIIWGFLQDYGGTRWRR
jgi:TonB family protein